VTGRSAELERAYEISEGVGLTGMIGKEIQNRHDASNTGRGARHQTSRIIGFINIDTIRDLRNLLRLEADFVSVTHRTLIRYTTNVFSI